MTVIELQAILEQLRARRTELDDIELKSAHEGTPTDIASTLCAFANRRGGGVLILGIEPTRFQIVGVKDPDQVQRGISEAASNLEPPSRVSFSAHVLEEKIVIVVEVPEVDPQFRPTFIRARGPYNGSYIRVGDGDRQMTQYEVYLNLISRSQPAEDLRPVDNASLQDLDESVLDPALDHILSIRPALSAFAGTDKTALLRALGIVSREDPPRPTVGGILLFGRYPQAFFPALVITITAYSSDHPDPVARLDGDVKCEGRLLDMLDEALHTTGRFMRSRTLVGGLLHETVPEYPPAAIREAIVNAVAHRDYSRYAIGTQIQVRFFPDRVEVQNPGGIHGALPVELLGELGLQNSRNAALARLLEDLGPMENRGTGLAAMASAMRTAHLAPPNFVDGTTYFRLTLHNTALVDERTAAWLGNFAHLSLSEQQRLALAFIRRFHRITNREYRLLGQPDSRQAGRDLKELVDYRLLEQRGLRGGTYYVLSAAVAAGPEVEGLDATARMVLSAIMAGGELGLSELTKTTGLSRSAANLAIRLLLDRGLVAPTTSNPRSPRRKYRMLPRHNTER